MTSCIQEGICKLVNLAEQLTVSDSSSAQGWPWPYTIFPFNIFTEPLGTPFVVFFGALSIAMLTLRMYGIQTTSIVFFTFITIMSFSGLIGEGNFVEQLKMMGAGGLIMIVIIKSVMFFWFAPDDSRDEQWEPESEELMSNLQQPSRL